MRITVFASGSTGNCALAECAGARILIDAGISLRRLKGFLAAERLTPGELDAVFITHEHRDHISGLAMLEKYHGLPVYALRPVASRLAGMLPELEGLLRPIAPGGFAELAGVRLSPFETEHDTPASAGLSLHVAGLTTLRFGPALACSFLACTAIWLAFLFLAWLARGKKHCQKEGKTV